MPGSIPALSPFRWRRSYVGRRRCFQFLQQHFHRLYKLWISTSGKRRGVFIHCDIRLNAVAFSEPGTVRIIHPKGRSCYTATVDQARGSRDPDQPAPRAGADQGPQTGLPEIIREGVASRTRPTVDQHDLGSKMSHRGTGPVFAVPHVPIDRKTVVKGKEEKVSVEIGGRRNIKKK